MELFNVQDVLNFIKPLQPASYIFLNGYCYWFAKILYDRFITFKPRIVYNIIDNHFATYICGHIFDVTGEIENCHFIDWDSYEDDVHKERLIKQCINF